VNTIIRCLLTLPEEGALNVSVWLADTRHIDTWFIARGSHAAFYKLTRAGGNNIFILQRLHA